MSTETVKTSSGDPLKTFNQLDQKDQETLAKAPALVSLLATNADLEMNDIKKEDAIKLAHIRTFTAEPMLRDFYQEVEKRFEINIENLNKILPKERAKREQAIKFELAKMERILSSLGKDYSAEFHRSLKSYAEHVSKAHGNALVSFMIPLYLKGLSE